MSYERSIGNKSAIGVAAAILVGSKQYHKYVDDFINFDLSMLPYYRYYFGKKRNNGFFLEGHSVNFSRETYLEDANEWRVGLGIAIGVKVALTISWSIDLVVGGGFNLNYEPEGKKSEWKIVSIPEVYPRLGLFIAKRF